MNSTFDEGWAIIHEGSTEKVFYLCLLKFLCKKHGTSIQKEELNNGLEIIYTLKINNRKYIIKTYDAGSLTNMPKTSKWFEEECAKNQHLDYEEMYYRSEINKRKIIKEELKQPEIK